MNQSIAPEIEDSELLRRYAEEGAEEAFAELVRRRIGLVYAVALRQSRGDRQRAEDAAQAVFIDLARKARTLAQRPVIASWLFRSAQFAAAGLARAEQRRRSREQEAYLMEKDAAPEGPEADWDKLRPVLDEALNEIDERDRDAIVLRFFDGRPFADIGTRLQVTDNAARMRVERALEKLQAVLARRGIRSTAAAVGLALGSQVATAAPAGLAAAVTGVALAGGTAVAGGGAVAVFMGMTKLQLGALTAITAAGVTGYMVQAETNAGLRREITATQVAPTRIETLRADNRQLAASVAEVEVLRGDDAEFKRLEQQVAEVRQAQAVRAQQARQAPDNRSPRAQTFTRIQEMDNLATAQVDVMNREGNRLVEEFKALQAELKDPALTDPQRALKQAAVDTKLEAIKAKQVAIQAFVQKTRDTLNEMIRNAPPPGPGDEALPSPSVIGGRVLTLQKREEPPPVPAVEMTVPPPVSSPNINPDISVTPGNR